MNEQADREAFEVWAESPQGSYIDAKAAWHAALAYAAQQRAKEEPVAWIEPSYVPVIAAVQPTPEMSVALILRDKPKEAT